MSKAKLIWRWLLIIGWAACSVFAFMDIGKADIEKMCSLAITDNNAFDCVKDGGYEIILTKDSSIIISIPSPPNSPSV